MRPSRSRTTMLSRTSSASSVSDSFVLIWGFAGMGDAASIVSQYATKARMGGDIAEAVKHGSGDVGSLQATKQRISVEWLFQQADGTAFPGPGPVNAAPSDR